MELSVPVVVEYAAVARHQRAGVAVSSGKTAKAVPNTVAARATIRIELALPVFAVSEPAVPALAAQPELARVLVVPVAPVQVGSLMIRVAVLALAAARTVSPEERLAAKYVVLVAGAVQQPELSVAASEVLADVTEEVNAPLVPPMEFAVAAKVSVTAKPAAEITVVTAARLELAVAALESAAAADFAEAVEVFAQKFAAEPSAHVAVLASAAVLLVPEAAVLSMVAQ